MKTPKKLIEVALPLDTINRASVRESYIYRGNPSALHKWWAQRPLAAARAVLFAQMVDDPSALPDLFPTERRQEKERRRLFKIIEDLVRWENTTNETVLQAARNEIWESWRRACAENADHPRRKQIFDRQRIPPFHDPFAGGGTLPLEAQRLGLDALASDLNPVAVLINKAMIEIPPRFVDRPPVNPESRTKEGLLKGGWKGAEGLAEDIRYYGQWIRDEAERRIGHLYPRMGVTAQMAEGRPDLQPYVGRELTVIAWLWARTVKSPNPAFASVDVPLASTFMLSTKKGKEAYVEPVIEDGGYRFAVKVGKPKDAAAAKSGTKLSRGAHFRCLMSDTPIPGEHIKAESKAGRMGSRLMAIVAQGDRGRVYLAPSLAHQSTAMQAQPHWRPEGAFVEDARAFTPCIYGITQWQQLFTERQLLALATLADLVRESTRVIAHHATEAGFTADSIPLREGGMGASAYAEALSVYLAFSIDKAADYNCALVPWYTREDRPGHLFSQQAIPIVWDYAEINPLADIGGGFAASIGIVAGALSGCAPGGPAASAEQADAASTARGADAIISTDPPYYDNVPYADLSDFFYVWLRHTLRTVYPSLFDTMAVPKGGELVALTYRHGGKSSAERFFMEGMTRAMQRLAKNTHPAYPVTIYYAFKQAERDAALGTASTGWETFLEATIRAGFVTTGTWPMRTEREGRARDIDSNALASSVVLVCRPRPADAPISTRREFVAALKAELPQALAHLQRGNIAPVDLAQAAIGPGMAVYTRYAQVLDAEGKPLTVREALALINQTLDEALAEQEGDFDADTRWALTWFEQQGFAEGEYGLAEQLSKSKNTSVQAMGGKGGFLESKRGKVRLLKPDELPSAWDPATDPRLTAWEVVHHLIRALTAGGEGAAAEFVAKLGGKAETARELAYRLYTLCERKKRAAEALAYNGLVQSFPEIVRLAQREEKAVEAQGDLFGSGE